MPLIFTFCACSCSRALSAVRPFVSVLSFCVSCLSFLSVLFVFLSGIFGRGPTDKRGIVEQRAASSQAIEDTDHDVERVSAPTLSGASGE